MKLFYEEAKQLVNKTVKDGQELTVVAITKEHKPDYDLNIIRLQLALWKSYQEGYRKGLEEGKKL